MPLTLERQRHRIWRALLPWAVGALPLLCGLVLLEWQVERNLHERSVATARQVVNHVERILDSVSAAAKILAPLAGRPCAEVTLALREQVTRNAFIRSTNLFANDILYCSSLFGAIHEPVEAQRYTEGQLWLMDGNTVTPDHALLVYRTHQTGRGVLLTVDGDHLITALQLIANDEALQIQVGTHWMGAVGRVHISKPPLTGSTPISLYSSRYPFGVHGGYPAHQSLRVLYSHYPALLALLCIIGTFIGMTCHWQLRRASSSRSELDRALQADEFTPYFQPVVRTSDYGWAGAEVLMRWQHPREGLVPPDLFIPYAEHSGQIVPMTRALMLRTAQGLAPYAAFMDEGFHIGINITADHCQDFTLLDECRAFLGFFPPGRVLLTLELTERKLLEVTPMTLELFEKLHQIGVKIALDDFGTGQSSLSYLRQFNIDYLKIDQSFVAMIGGDALSQHILDTIIELSRKLDLAMVAEGVETEAQRDYLARHQVDLQQGYLHARPMPLEAFIQALAARSSSGRLPPDTPAAIMPG